MKTKLLTGGSKDSGDRTIAARKGLCFLCVLLFNLPSAFAVYLQPFWYYGRDPFGLPLTNAITIDAWPATNDITANNTNLVFSVAHTFLPDANGFVSNNIALGNYRLKVLGFSAGAPFSILSNASPINISSTANVPVTTFLNFTLAQIIDAGSIARRGSNEFALASPAGITNNLGFIPANAANTNDFARATEAGVTNSLGFIPARAADTNDFARATPAGVTNALGYIPANAANSNDFARATTAGITAALGYTPGTNLFNWNTADNPTNSYVVNTLYTNTKPHALLFGWAFGTLLHYTNDGIGYQIPVTNTFSVPLSTNSTFFFDNHGTITNVVNWY